MDAVACTSLVVRQFVAFVRRDVPVHEPKNEFVTEAVEAEVHVCSKCCVEGVWDVWIGSHDGLSFKLGRCRCCGMERTL